MEDALRRPEGKLYAIFMDYTKAFDLLDTVNIESKLEMIPDCSQAEKNLITNEQSTMLG
jgi:hypothetical protein